MRPLVRPLSLLIACATLLSACQGLSRNVEANRFESLGGAGLEVRQPADIALAPLRNQSGRGEVPLEGLRSAFQGELVRRLYSPLGLAFVDAHWDEASFAGAPPPDALLMIAITGWDESGLRSRGVLKAEAELRLYEGGSPEGPLLWGGRVARRVDLNLSEGQVGLLKELRPKAIKAFAAQVLAELPERDPTAVQR